MIERNRLTYTNYIKLSSYIIANLERYKKDNVHPEQVAVEATKSLGFSVSERNVETVSESIDQRWWHHGNSDRKISDRWKNFLGPVTTDIEQLKQEVAELKRQNALLLKDVEMLMSMVEQLEDKVTLPASLAGVH